MKKFIAFFVALCVSLSLVQTTFAANATTLEISDIRLIDEQSTDELESDIVGTKKFTSVHPVDPKGGSYMLYMEDEYATGHNFSTRNFLGPGWADPKYSAIAWPPKLRDAQHRSGLPLQQAEINKENDTLYTLYSKRTGITYKLPERNFTVTTDSKSGVKTVTGAEVAIIDRYGWINGFNVRPAADISVYKKVDKIHFLLATGCNNTRSNTDKKSGTSPVGVYVNYDDGSNTIPHQWTVASGVDDSCCIYNFNNLVDNVDALGENGYLCINLPRSINGQTNDHFVADFENYYCFRTYDKNVSNWKTIDYEGNFVKNYPHDPNYSTTVAAYEYTIDVDETKTIKDIVFVNEAGIARSGIAILGMAYEYREDVGIKGQVESLNASTEHIAALGSDATLEQIINTTNKMIDLEDKGYGEYIYFNEKTGFGSDNDREITTVNKNSHFEVNFTANNSSSTPTDMYLITALYDENDTLVDAIKTDVTIPARWKKSNISANVNLPNKYFSYARFYVWDDGIEPYGTRLYNIDDIYTQVSLTDFANGKFYVSADRPPVKQYTSKNPTELRLYTYNNDVNFNGDYDFAGITSDKYHKTAAYYPLQTKEGNTEILNPYDGLLHSEKTGVKYAMPQKRDGVHNKEVVTISNKEKNRTATIDLEDDIYEKIHFIVSASNQYATKLRAIVNFTDGSREVEYFDICEYEDTTNNHCIANLSNVASVDIYEFGYINSNTEAVNLLMLEYSMDINNPKVVDSITFELIEKSRLEVVPEKSIGNVVLTALTTEKESYQTAKTYLENKMSSEYLDEEADALREIADFLESKGIDCNDLDIPATNNSARQVFISADANASIADGSMEKPFATVDAACEYIRSNTSYIGDWEVLFREGTYEVTETITINEESLPNVASVTFKPYNGEKVEFTGSKEIDMSKKTLATDIASRLPSSSVGKVYKINLTEQGITDISPYVLLKYMKQRTPASRIIIDEISYNVARWPNEGTKESASFALIDSVPNATSDYSTQFTIEDASTSNINKWNNSNEAILQGFFEDNNWCSNSFKFASYNSSTKAVTGDENLKVYHNNDNKRFFIENLLEEIDNPGEWYIDHATNTLYIYPVAGAKKYSISTFKDYIFKVSNLNNIHIEGFLFNGSVGGAICFENSNNCEIKGCDIRNFTSTPIKLVNCKNSGVMSCDMSMLGSGAIYIDEFDFQSTFTSGNNYITDCKIENSSTYARTAGEGAVICLYHTIGTRITNNKISDSTTQAITGAGINMSIKYNDISYVQKEYGDAGAIYFGQTFMAQGNEISNNYIHDMTPFNNVGIHCGIYLDDLCCGYEVKNNVIENVSRGMLLGGGKDITVENNLIWVSEYALVADQRGIDWNNQAEAPKRRTELIAKIRENPLYRLSFPHTMSEYYLGDEYYNKPANNKIMNNFFYKANPYIYSKWEDATLNNYVSNNTKVTSITSSAFRTDANNNSAVEFNRIGLITER